MKGNPIVETATNGAAVAAVASPVWLPWLHTASEITATVAPILGAIWLIVQIISKVTEIVQKWRHRED
ncbi:hypothetical protein CQ059_05440 [Brucella pseudogrignonensis]|nr:hypothetical protein CQ059_05440 [Brucella pseudogrignonensis]PRA43122.1 hypothetical protein CQ063_01925 [Brucella pseudogrignonensis]PRA72408.1 hypothetical protein CQ055_03655 [Brucella pseudogrignonensis]